MRVLLVWPYGACDGLTMPLCYLYLLPILRRAGHDVRLADCALDGIAPDSDAFAQILADVQPDVVGVSAWTIHRDAATATLRAVKRLRPQAITVAGGPHFTSVANYSIRNDADVIDYVLKGETEETFPSFLDAVKAPRHLATPWLRVIPGLCFIDRFGMIVESEPAQPKTLDAFGQPDYAAIRLQDYLNRGYRYRTSHNAQAPILTTRGCPYTCDFCAAPALNGKRVRRHSNAYLETMIDTLWAQGIRHFNIIDDNWSFDVGPAKDFCRMVIANHDRWPGIILAVPLGLRVERTDRELFDLMYAAGWRRIIVAPESGSQRMVDRMAKHLDLSVVPGKVAAAKAAGLEVEAFFILGHPGEDAETVDATEAFIRALRFDAINVHYFQPIPGTPIHNDFLAHGTLTNELRITSFGDVNWIPDGWTRASLQAASARLMTAAAEARPS